MCSLYKKRQKWLILFYYATEAWLSLHSDWSMHQQPGAASGLKGMLLGHTSLHGPVHPDLTLAAVQGSGFSWHTHRKRVSLPKKCIDSDLSKKVF